MPRNTPFFLILITMYTLLSVLYVSSTPSWQAPDEPAHYNAIRFVAQEQRLPVLEMGCYDQAYLSELTSRKFPPELSIDSICYQHYQPPLYYLAATPVFHISGGNVWAARFFSAFLGGLALWLVYRTVWLITGVSALALGTMAFMALIPMHLSVLGSVNNDSLAELLLIALLYVLFAWLLYRAPHQRPVPLVTGVLLGLILLTKVTAYISIPLAALVLLLGDRRLQAIWQNGLRIFGPALLIAIPLYLRNAWVYGNLDVLGLQRHDLVVVGQLRTADYLANVGWFTYGQTLLQTTFHSFWGQFGWMAVPMDGRVYFVLLLLSGLALLGLGLWSWKRYQPGHTGDLNNRVLLVLVAQVLLVTLIFAGLNLSFVQFQGRYLFPALLPLGLAFTLGWREVLQPRRAWAAALASFGLTALVLLPGMLAGDLNGWVLLLGGSIGIGFVVWPWLPYASRPTSGLALLYTALAVLALLSPWWFIRPHL